MRAVPEDPQIEDVPHEPFYPSDTRTHPSRSESRDSQAPRQKAASRYASNLPATLLCHTRGLPLRQARCPLRRHASQGNVDGPLLA